MMTPAQLSILIIDDDFRTRSSLRRILKLDGYRVEEAGTAAEALNRENWKDYFAILLDRNLPDGTAEELLPDIRRLAPDASILIVTGDADLDSSIAAMRNGAADYLLKPVEPESLRARLRGLAALWISRDELSRRDAEMEFMIDHLPAAAAYVDLESSTVRFNAIVEEITGYSRSELTTLDECFDKFFGPLAAIARTQYDQNHKSWSSESLRLKIIRKDLQESVVEFRGYRYDGHEVWLFSDVTERNRHEMALQIRERAIQAANEGVVIADVTRDGHPVVFVNRAFEAITGYSADEAIGRSCDLLCGPDPDDDVVEKLKSAINNQQEFRSTLQCFRKDGTPFWNEISTARVKSGSGNVTHIVAVMNDVTDRRRAQQQLLQSERLAAIGEMVTGLAHESRNALQRAQACLDMLSLDLEDQPEQLELTEKTRRALQDLNRHYEEVRNYAAPINLQCRPTNLAKLWRSTWDNLKPAIAGRDFRLIDSACDDSLMCYVDDHRIEQVFRNILENSVSACSGSGRITVSCDVVNHGDCDYVQVSFCDNGPGIDAENAENVFMPFFTTKQKGTGLGMAISKRIVESHGGCIEIGKSSKQGAEVIVTLPLYA